MVGALSKLRTLLNSKLENQKAPAQLLVAVEQSLDESQQGTGDSVIQERSAGEYYLALESMLEKAMAKGVSRELKLPDLLASDLRLTGPCLPPPQLL